MSAPLRTDLPSVPELLEGRVAVVREDDDLTTALDDALADPPDLLLVGGDADRLRRAAGRVAGTPTVLGTHRPDPGTGRVVETDLGRAGRRPFLGEASLGLAIGVADRLTPALERRWHGLARPVATARAHRRAVPLGVRLGFPDGDHPRLDVVRALQVSVALRDGLLEVHCLGDLPLRQALAVERRRRAGTPVEHERVHRVVARAVRVVTTPSTDLSLDGGVDTYTPITLTVQRGALRMLCRRSAVAPGDVRQRGAHVAAGVGLVGEGWNDTRAATNSRNSTVRRVIMAISWVVE